MMRASLLALIVAIAAPSSALADRTDKGSEGLVIRLESPVAKKTKVIKDGVIWNCLGVECEADRPLKVGPYLERAERAIEKRVGAVAPTEERAAPSQVAAK